MKNQPLFNTLLEVIWQAPTNDWPSSLWVYKVVPHAFPPAVISNLMAMASFSMSENKSVPGMPGYEKDKIPPLYFSTPDQKTRVLGICPAYGYVFYRNLSADGIAGKPIERVPTEAEAYCLALEYMRKFGIDRSQLASKVSTNEYAETNDLAIRRILGTRGWTDEVTHQEINDVYKRGFFFVRRVDGIDIDGIARGGVEIGFGENAQISVMEITWRGLEPHQLHSTISPTQVLDEIRLGHATWLPSAPNQPVKRITVTSFEILYRGQPGDVEPAEQQRFVAPYVVIYASLGDGDTNDVKCYSEMPIFLNK